MHVFFGIAIWAFSHKTHNSIYKLLDVVLQAGCKLTAGTHYLPALCKADRQAGSDVMGFTSCLLHHVRAAWVLDTVELSQTLS